MSKPITINDIKIHRSDSGARPTVIHLALSNWKSEEIEVGFNHTVEQMMKTVANRVVELNQTSRPERLSKGLVETLIEIRRAVGRKDENSVHLQRDLNLSKTEYNNAQKLRFHGLIAHDETAGAGYWLITRLGGEFLRGETARPRAVMVSNNEIVGRDEVLVTIEDVLKGDAPRFDEKQDFWPVSEPLEMTQVGLAL